MASLRMSSARSLCLAAGLLVVAIALLGRPVAAEGESISGASGSSKLPLPQLMPEFEFDESEKESSDELEGRQLVGENLVDERADEEEEEEEDEDLGEPTRMLAESRGQSFVGAVDDDEADVFGEAVVRRDLHGTKKLTRKQQKQCVWKNKKHIKRVCKNYKQTHYKCCAGKKGGRAECVNTRTNLSNCGGCRKTCTNRVFRRRFRLSRGASIKAKCCFGKCVNVQSNCNHCGGCGKKCPKGGKCRRGVCSNKY